MKPTHRSRWIIAIVALLVLALGATAVFAQSTDTLESGTVDMHGGFGGRGQGFGGPGAEDQGTYLAEALGITVEELQTAQENARLAALEQAVELGLITQEQADWIIANGGFGPFGHHRGMFSDEIDFEALLAQALGISVDELTAAKQAAAQARLDQALADGLLTQDQYDLMQAHQALQDYIDRDALMAEALGLTVEELTAAREAGTPVWELIADAGLTMPEFMTAMNDAHTAAINQAVADGVITQAQADLILANPMGFGPGGHGGRGGHGGPGFGGMHGSDGMMPDTTAPAAPLNTGSNA